jgi:kinesin family protein 22
MEGVREQEREAAIARAREEAQAEANRQREQEALERQRRDHELTSDFTRAGEESWGQETTANMDAEADGSAELRLPPGVLTPLLKRHADLDGELTKRLEELERRLERGDKEMKMADVMTPVSRKKTGRAYVSLARQHTEKYVILSIQFSK